MKAQFPDEQTDSGEFQRQKDAFREWISKSFWRLTQTPYSSKAEQ